MLDSQSIELRDAKNAGVSQYLWRFVTEATGNFGGGAERVWVGGRGIGTHAICKPGPLIRPYPLSCSYWEVLRRAATYSVPGPHRCGSG